MRAVRNTAELQRIVALPRRPIDSVLRDELVADMTEALRRPGGTMTLRKHQAAALYEAGVHGGLFAPLGVGEGKCPWSWNTGVDVRRNNQSRGGRCSR
jgi:hypothetical protein